MKKIPVTLYVFLFLLVGITLLSSTSARGAESKPFLADKHQRLSIACDQCHKETPPKEKVPTEACIGCHGGYDKLPGLTKKINPNPHDPHDGDLPCESCHHAHKASEDYCLNCHNFGFKVP
jgi:hypothetical protein